MCLQCASQGEKDEDRCKRTFSGGQKGVLTRVLKRTMEMAALMGRLQFLLLELLSTNTCVNTYASARKTHGSKCTKTNLAKAFRANHGTPANISEPSFQHALVFGIKTAILWTRILCPFQRCLTATAEPPQLLRMTVRGCQRKRNSVGCEAELQERFVGRKRGGNSPTCEMFGQQQKRYFFFCTFPR